MSFWQDLTGDTAADASKAAALDTYQKQNVAINDLKAYGDQYAGQFKDLSTKYDPYVSAGGSALERLMSGLGLGGNGENFTAAYHALPGYQAGLTTGTNAITGSAAARGMLKSGSTLKGLEKFGQNYEDQKSGDYLARLMAMTGQGQSAIGAQNATVGTGLQGQLGTRTAAFGGAMNAAGTIGQGDIAAANAKAAGSQNLLNTGLKIGGMAIGAATGNPLMMMGGGGGGGGSAYGGSGSSGFSGQQGWAPSYPNPQGGSWYLP